MAAQEVRYKSGDSVNQLMERFDQRGLAALQIALRRGCKETYTAEELACILAEVQRISNREKDGKATWSLPALERALRKKALPQTSATAIRDVFYASGYAQRHNPTLNFFRSHTGEVRATGVLSTPNSVLPLWLKEHLQPLREYLEINLLMVRQPLPDDHLTTLEVVL